MGGIPPVSRIGASHRFKRIPVAGSTTYSTNLGLRYVPPVLRLPGIVGALPNSADGCGYVLTINGAATKTRQD